MERIYTELAIEEIPWNLEEPPLAGAGGPHQRCYHVASVHRMLRPGGLLARWA